ncbi:cation diffusion facilitator family transporter, partial [Intestinibacter sp.]|uniref:cation diffusion facilitator family transporter n=1 Tax=Intestinibacter sp. TaxID=1965304 RepID=UPI003F176E99
YEYSAGKKLNSYILISDSLHTKSDIFISIGVLVTLILIKLGAPIIIDKIVSFVVAVFILYAAFKIFKFTIDILVDRAVIEENDLKDAVSDFEEIKEIHNIRSRGSESDIYVDMHIMVEPDMTVETSHELEHNIERKIQEKINQNIQVIIHMEPYYKL